MSESMTYLRSLLPKRPGEDVLAQAYGSAYLYLFKGTKENLDTVMTRNTVAGQSWKLRKFQRLVRYDGGLLKDNKATAYERVLGITQSTWAVSDKDKRVLTTALTYPALQAKLTSYAKTGYRPLTNAAYDRAITKALQSRDLSTYMAKFVAHKMAFITGSKGIPPAEVISDLKESATYALLRAYPVWADMGHLLAIAKTAVHNRGINFIKEHTTQSRSHLQQDAKGAYSAVNLSLSLFADAAQAGDATGVNRSEGDHLITTLDGSRASDHVFSPDLLRSLRQLVTSPTLTAKQREYLKLMVGYEDMLFTAYLGQSNSDLVHSLSFPQYHAKVCEFLNVTEERAAQFLQSLKTYL